MGSPELEQQQEKLRRAVDGWRFRSLELLKDLRGDPYAFCSHSAAAGVSDYRGAGFRPIGVRVETLEHSDLSSLVDSDNVDVAKFVMVLSYDCVEIARLRRHASINLYRQLLMFGHRASPQEVPLEGEPQKVLAQSLSLFMELYETASRMSAILGNLLRQLEQLYSRQDKNGLPYISFKNTSLRSVLESFGEGLVVLLVLDEILRRNTHIKSHVSLFRRMLSKVKLEQDKFDISVKDLDCLHQIVGHLEKLLDGSLFHCILHEGSYLNGTFQKVKCNKQIFDAFSLWTYDGLTEILPRLDTWKEFPLHRKKLLQHVAVFLFVACAENPDKKLKKVIMDMLQVVPVIYADCGIRFAVFDLIRNQCPQLISSWPPMRDAVKNSDVLMKNYLIRLSETHSRDWQAINDALSCWVVSFQANANSKVFLSYADFQLQLRQLIQGMVLANRMHILTLSILDLHALLEVPIQKEKFKSLCHMLVQLKVIANTISAKGPEIILYLPHVISLLQSNIEELLQPAKVQLHLDIKKGGQSSKLRFLGSLIRGKDTDTRVTNSFSLILISMQLLQGNGSLRRQLIFSITMDAIQSIGYVEIEFPRIKKILSKLNMIVDFQSIVADVTDCSFLYWRKEMMKDLLSMVYIDNKFSWLPYLLDALCDGFLLLDMGNVGKLSQHSYEQELEDSVTDEIILPLCRDIENDLRLHVHSANLKGSVNVNILKTGVRNLSWYLQLRPLRLPHKFVNIQTLVECYLNSTFYNHTAMALYNWKVYSEMRLLAELKYKLLLDDIHLPEHCSGQGFDLAEVLKDMQTFARNYSYNITKQIFIEKVTDGQRKKSLIIFGVDYISAAVASHGLTTISIASKNLVGFLTQKMSALSEVLQDDLLRSLLQKERIWKNEKSASNKYPFSRAEQLCAAMVKHPFRGHEVNIVDQLCCIITEMGNVLGLIRLLYTATSHRACQISSFRWQHGNDLNFIEKDRPSTSTVKAVTQGKSENEEDENFQSIFGIDYFSSILTSVTKELKNGEYPNLVDFCFTIPALIFSLIESKLHLKEKPLRRDREPANRIITDDGFVVGATCVLKVTGQDGSFGELYWFASANKHLEELLVSLERETEQPKESRIFGLKLWDQPPVTVSPETHKAMDRLRRWQKEMKLMEYGFNIARVLMMT